MGLPIDTILLLSRASTVHQERITSEGILKSWKSMPRRHTSGHIIPISVRQTELGIQCPLVYLQLLV